MQFYVKDDFIFFCFFLLLLVRGERLVVRVVLLNLLLFSCNKIYLKSIYIIWFSLNSSKTHTHKHTYIYCLCVCTHMCRHINATEGFVLSFLSRLSSCWIWLLPKLSPLIVFGITMQANIALTVYLVLLMVVYYLSFILPGLVKSQSSE